MLKAWVAVLAVANLALAAWAAGWGSPWLPPPDDQGREPHRLAQQLHPERVEVLPGSPAPLRATPAPPAAASAAPVAEATAAPMAATSAPR